MSRSKPNDTSPNPCERWFEWAGGNNGGFVRYYDKTSKSNVTVPLPFVFIVLDELSCVRGWHDNSESGIYSNAIRDTRQDVLLVKAFKGGELANGHYAAIRDRVKAVGGHFESSVYIGFKDGTRLALGNLAFKGAALGAWMEFRKENRKDIYKSAVMLSGFEDRKKGGTDFRIPVFKLAPISEATESEAVALDTQLQEYLTSYLARTRDEQVQPEAAAVADVAATDVYEQMAGEAASGRGAEQAKGGEFYDDPVPF